MTARVGDLVLAEAAVAAGAPAPRIKPAKRFTRRLRKNRAIRARLVVEATDEYGNRSVVTTNVKAKRAKKKRKRSRRAGG